MGDDCVGGDVVPVAGVADRGARDDELTCELGQFAGDPVIIEEERV